MTSSSGESTDVHNHGPDEGPGLQCRETRQPDGRLRGQCMDGLRDKYRVERHDDPTGKHNDCRYFVLDPQHDPIAREALALYAARTSNADLRCDLRVWLDSLTKHAAAVAALIATGQHTSATAEEALREWAEHLGRGAA